MGQKSRNKLQPSIFYPTETPAAESLHLSLITGKDPKLPRSPDQMEFCTTASRPRYFFNKKRCWYLCCYRCKITI